MAYSVKNSEINQNPLKSKLMAPGARTPAKPMKKQSTKDRVRLESDRDRSFVK